MRIRHPLSFVWPRLPPELLLLMRSGRQPESIKWEYKASGCEVKQWADLGDDGWELVSTLPPTIGRWLGNAATGYENDPNRTGSCVAFFKRPKK